MSILEAITLGVVQGLTEFLPVSSTAHLRIVPEWLGWNDPGAGFSAVIQCGTLLAVCAAMHKDIGALVAGLLQGIQTGRPLGTAESRTAIMVGVGTLPIVIVGFAARHLIRGEARELRVIAAAMFFATVLLGVAEGVCWWRARHGQLGRDGLAGVRLDDGLTMGLLQVLALIPGTSRSGVTIASGMLTGLDRRTAARFSFLLSLPAVAAAGLLEAWQQRAEIFGSQSAVAAATCGILSAAAVGFLAIRWLLKLLTSHTLWPFIVYRLAVAALLVGSCGLPRASMAIQEGAPRTEAMHRTASWGGIATIFLACRLSVYGDLSEDFVAVGRVVGDSPRVPRCAGVRGHTGFPGHTGIPGWHLRRRHLLAADLARPRRSATLASGNRCVSVRCFSHQASSSHPPSAGRPRVGKHMGQVFSRCHPLPPHR